MFSLHFHKCPFDFWFVSFCLFVCLKDYYKILEVDYDATEELIRLNYRKLALKWHPDKHKGDSAATEKFQEINEAYNGKSFFCIVGFYRNINTMLLTWYLIFFIGRERIIHEEKKLSLTMSHLKPSTFPFSSFSLIVH